MSVNSAKRSGTWRGSTGTIAWIRRMTIGIEYSNTRATAHTTYRPGGATASDASHTALPIA